MENREFNYEDIYGSDHGTEDYWDPLDTSREDFEKELQEEEDARYEKKQFEQYRREHNTGAEDTVVNAAATNKKHGNAYRPDIDKMEVMELREKGYSLRKIAKLVDCSVNTVKNRLSEE